MLFAVTDDLRARRALQAGVEAPTLVAAARLDAHLADPFGAHWQVAGHQGVVGLTDLGRPPALVGGDRV